MPHGRLQRQTKAMHHCSQHWQQSPPLVWHGRLPGVPRSPSLHFRTYSSIIFQDRIFWILDLISGGFCVPNLDFFRYFSLSFFGIVFGSIFFRFFADFGPLESLILVLPPARELNFHKIHVLGIINKFGPKMLVLRLQNRCKIEENRRKKRILKQVLFQHRIFSIFVGFWVPS